MAAFSSRGVEAKMAVFAHFGWNEMGGFAPKRQTTRG
jgi:hypothetical protein